MRIIRRANLHALGFGLIALIFLAGCDQQAMIERYAPPQETAFAKQFISQIASSDLETAENQLDPTLKDAQLRTKLQQVAAQFPPGAPSHVKLIGTHTFKTAQLERFNLTFEYAYPGRWVLANVILEKKKNGNLLVTGVHVNPLVDSLENINRLTFAGKGFIHYLFLAFTVAIPVFVLATLILCIRTPIQRRKWAWIIAVLLGATQLSFNWTTGEVGFATFHVSLLGGGFLKSGPAAPLILHFGMPIGALIFLIKRRGWRRAEAQ